MSEHMFTVKRRDGLYSLNKTAKEMCRFIVLFAPVIQRLYPENVLLKEALDAALAACELLRVQVQDQMTPGV